MASIIEKTVCLLLILSCRYASAQLVRPFSDEVKFVQYLQDREQYHDAVIALGQISPAYLTPVQADTLNYLKGWNFYNTKTLDSSARYLLKVSDSSGYYLKSRFFGAYNYIYLHHYDEAGDILQAIPAEDHTVGAVRRFETAGMALLRHDYRTFDSLQRQFAYNLYAISAQEKNFSTYRKQLAGLKRKSPVLAGLMSAVIPGSGKIYAGKTYQGIASMLPIAALALLTNESYHKRGPRSAELYIFGSLLTVFYAGNIWGSVFAVKINREEHEKLIHQKILLDLQIPLRTIFN